jgi:hydrogenase-4 component F
MYLILIIATAFVATLVSLPVLRRWWLIEAITVVAGVTELALSIRVATIVICKGTYSFGSYFSADAMAVLLLLITSVVGCAASFYSVGYIRTEAAKNIIGPRRIHQYYVLLQLFFTAMYLAILSNNPIIMWMAIEATTLSTAFLVSFYNKPSAMEAAWKYLIINSIGLLLGFWGTLLFFSGIAKTGGMHGLISWEMLSLNPSSLNPLTVKVAFIFIFVGYGTKMGLAPMHTWLPDAHSKAPIPISSLLSAVLLNIAFFAILRFKGITDQAIGPEFSRSLLIFFGILSVVISALIIFVQKNYKRLLAYSSIENMGIIALGFGFGGAAVFPALLQMIYHSLAKSILFLSSGSIFVRYSSTKIAKVRGVLKAMPLTTALFIVGALAITGTPPMGTFISEFSILASGILRHPVPVIILAISLVIIFAGFLKHVSEMFFGEKPEEIIQGETSYWRIVPIGALAVLLITLGFFLPEPLRHLLWAAASRY